MEQMMVSFTSLFLYMYFYFHNFLIEKLKSYFEQYGAVQDAVVMKDPVTRRSRGFGFITYTHPAYVDQALAIGIHVIDSRKVALPSCRVSLFPLLFRWKPRGLFLVMKLVERSHFPNPLILYTKQIQMDIITPSPPPPPLPRGMLLIISMATHTSTVMSIHIVKSLLVGCIMTLVTVSLFSSIFPL
jgi:hypothetical protein